MSDPLFEAVRALRDATRGEASTLERYTRSRVLASVRLQKRRRVLNIAFGIPLAAVLIGSGAWAASGRGMPVFVQRVSVALGLREQPSMPAVSTLPKPSPARSSRAPNFADGVATLELGQRAGAQPSEGAVSIEAGASEDAAVASNIGQGAPVEPVGGATLAAANPQPSSRLPRDSRVTEQELTLYEHAHRAHFVDRDAGSALTAWSEYLRRVPAGRFAVEARYNRAMCLLRLGRSEEARVALEPFARGAFGNYRKSEANALLERLASGVSP